MRELRRRQYPQKVLPGVADKAASSLFACIYEVSVQVSVRGVLQKSYNGFSPSLILCSCYMRRPAASATLFRT